MKKITVLIPDSIPLSQIIVDSMALFDAASEVKMETVGEVEPTSKDVIEKSVKINESENILDFSMERTTTFNVIMRHYEPEGKFTSKQALKWYTKYDYAETGCGATLSKLVEYGFIARNVRGSKKKLSRYFFIKPLPKVSWTPSTNTGKKPENLEKLKFVHSDPNMSTLNSIMQHYENGIEFSRRQASTWLTDAGYKETGVGSALSDLTSKEFIFKTDKGRFTKYTFLKPLPERWSRPRGRPLKSVKE